MQDLTISVASHLTTNEVLLQPHPQYPSRVNESAFLAKQQWKLFKCVNAMIDTLQDEDTNQQRSMASILLLLFSSTLHILLDSCDMSCTKNTNLFSLEWFLSYFCYYPLLFFRVGHRSKVRVTLEVIVYSTSLSVVYHKIVWHLWQLFY